MFADRKVSFEEIKEIHGLNISLSDYIESVADNALDVEKYLSKKDSILKGPEIQKLHFLLNKNVARDAGAINGKRHLPFFDKEGKKDMVEGRRIFQELKLLDLQTQKLMKLAGTNKEEKIKVACFQAMRLFAIHPFNDANKRIVKLLIGNFLQKELQLTSKIPWKEIPQKVINQAVRGNNIGPFAKAICENYGLDYDPNKISDIELTPYKIYPDTGTKIYSFRKELERSKIRMENQICAKDPLITKKELNEMGFKTKSLNPFKTLPVVEDLIATKTPESLLHKTRQYLSEGKISEQQAKNLLKQTITVIDGTNEKFTKLATDKMLSGEISDVKKAVHFYEKYLDNGFQNKSSNFEVISIQESSKDSQVQKVQTNHTIRL
ncbi:MAG: Fic family protein [Lentisphaeraceae bacterium]|nr:Fic family protein [Lentisphaeraceae bacterium]